MKHCNRIEEACVCKREEGHKGLHMCECGGSWNFDDGKFDIGTLPGSNPEFEWGSDMEIPAKERLYE